MRIAVLRPDPEPSTAETDGMSPGQRKPSRTSPATRQEPSVQQEHREVRRERPLEPGVAARQPVVQRGDRADGGEGRVERHGAERRLGVREVRQQAGAGCSAAGPLSGCVPDLAAYTKPRADLHAILLTGLPSGVVPGFQNVRPFGRLLGRPGRHATARPRPRRPRAGGELSRRTRGRRRSTSPQSGCVTVADIAAGSAGPSATPARAAGSRRPGWCAPSFITVTHLADAERGDHLARSCTTDREVSR